MAILVSGGAGYIGSHTCIELLNAGYDIVVADNYYNASPVVLDRVKQITGKDFRFYKADMTRREDVEKIFSECPDITAVIQFAAYKAVGESVSKPIEYYYNNLNCTLVILDVMRHHDCHNFVFSSSATVYGDPASVPITEDFPVGATTNPYGTTKAFTERILQDVCKADPSLNVALLRYFNPIGAHKSGLIGEDPNGIPNNLMPYIAKVAVGKLEKVHVFGNDYPTPDGTGVRDYIHVVDLARGHVCAIRKLETGCGLFICNLGTGSFRPQRDRLLPGLYCQRSLQRGVSHMAGAGTAGEYPLPDLVGAEPHLYRVVPQQGLHLQHHQLHQLRPVLRPRTHGV
jgi:UDP-glucose 4-epimerase